MSDSRARPAARRVALAALGVLAVAAAIVDARADGKAGTATQYIGAIDVARLVRAGSNLVLLDLRDSAAFAEARLHGARRATPATVAMAASSASDTLVLYADSDVAAMDAARAARGAVGATVLVLRGGLPAWTSEVLAPPAPALGADSAALARHREAVALSRWFGGLPSLGDEMPSEVPTAPARRDRRIFRGC